MKTMHADKSTEGIEAWCEMRIDMYSPNGVPTLYDKHNSVTGLVLPIEPGDLDEITCLACLDALIALGLHAATRAAALRVATPDAKRL